MQDSPLPPLSKMKIRIELNPFAAQTHPWYFILKQKKNIFTKEVYMKSSYIGKIVTSQSIA